MRPRIMFGALGWLTALFLLTGCPLVQSENAGQVWYVNQLASGIGDGISWESAFTTPQEAMDAAVAGDEIWIAEGIYGPSASDGTPVLVMAAGIRIYGGFAGGEDAAVLRDPAIHVTIFDGSETADHVIVAADRTVIDGLTITGGRADGNGNGEEAAGGGIFISSSSVTIQRCRIEGNFANMGGGIYNDGGVIVVIDSSLSGNEAVWGGAMENYQGSALIINTSFSKNRSQQNGGAVSNYFSSPVFVNSVFSGNETTFSGGAVFNYEGSPVFANCTLTGNRVFDGAGTIGKLGASTIGNLGASPTIINSLLWNNQPVDNPEITAIGSSVTVTVRYSDVQGGYAGSGNMDQSPAFMDDGSWNGNVWVEGDYHLTSGSPLIDSGTSGGAPNFDKDGNFRPQGQWHDIGAFEYLSEN